MTLISALAFLVCLVAWVLEMVLFGVARDHMRDRGIDATWGNANWMGPGAPVNGMSRLARLRMREYIQFFYSMQPLLR